MSTGRSGGEESSGPAYAERIAQVKLPDPVRDLVTEYEAVGGERDRFVWKWIYDLFPAFTLSSVPERHAEKVRTGKTVYTIYITLLDDIAERNGDAGTFDRIRRRVCWPDAESGDTGTASDATAADTDPEVVAFAERVWVTFEEIVAGAPREEEFRELFWYDFRQALNAMEYSRLLNERPLMANLNGAKHYDSHNMVLFSYADVDLMYSPGFDRADLGELRELIWDLQRMARIGNWVSTWEREVREGDFTAGIVVYAIQNGLVTREELEAAAAGETAVIERLKAQRIEDLFLAEWEQLSRELGDRDFDATTVDLDAFVDGMRTVMEHHMASKGHK